MMWLLTSVLAAASCGVAWHFPATLLALLGVRMYVVKDKDMSSAFLKNVTRIKNANCTVLLYEDGRCTPSGIITCFRRPGGFVAYVGESSGSGRGGEPATVTIFTTASSVQALLDKNGHQAANNGHQAANNGHPACKNGEASRNGDADASDSDEDATPEPKLTLWGTGPCYYDQYFKKVFEVPFAMEARPEQKRVVDEIVADFSRGGRRGSVMYLHGPPGTGKSKVASFLARELCPAEPQLCKAYNPTEPGSSLDELVRAAEPSAERPLVVLLDEVDRILERVHHGRVVTHKDIRTTVYDKSTWNAWLDGISDFYPYVLILMTSNVSREALGALFEDSSYLREGRVDYVSEMSRII
jgi:hypothetical protein